ncbi:MAG: hypothetical protein DI606_02155 [Sphingobium sp.]|uniref:hypothetical protein n=1 Tax=Sphingobium sp. TaxID=1912891 RepID=UPI000DB0E7DB|nr:hypothetical protein [Sphingobium sp.]PZU14465.1 MAG: hypothetical protein DI606_02155 [Sphingobium sp.]
MQEFFMDYGLWLLIGLLVVIALVFLLSGKRRDDAETQAPPATVVDAPEVEVAAIPPAAPQPASPPSVSPSAPPVEPDPAPLAAAPEPALQPVAAASDGQADDLLKLKGVGPKLHNLLIELGVTRFSQIADWSDADIAAIDARLGNFKGRPVRDQWVDQAKYLAAGDIAGFEAKYGKL